jgi:RNA polymerase sigma factor (TIGR02999 family)
LEPIPSQATVLLSRSVRGDPAAAAELIPLVYDQLRGLAREQLRRETSGQTLQPTALVHEAWLRLIGQTRVDWRGRAHFYAVAATMMRRVLIEGARARKRLKRGGGEGRRLTLEPSLALAPASQEVDLLELDEALTKLARLHERQARVVELRFFSGLSVEETAHALEVASRTVEDDWAIARAWLRRELGRSRRE